MRVKGPRPSFETPEQLQAVFNGYFENTQWVDYTLTGLALAIGTSRATIERYGKMPGFKEIVSEARLIVEHAYELKLGTKASKGAQFALCNLGWDNKQTTDVTLTDKDGNSPKWRVEVVNVDNTPKAASDK